jgi:uncharacterized membrane protein
VEYVAALVYLLGSFVCHQIPERSFHVAGSQLPVCARCTGLYVGGAVGVVVWLARRNRGLSSAAARWALSLTAVPTLITLATAELGWWDPVNGTRAALALPLGLVVGAVVIAGLTRNLR